MSTNPEFGHLTTGSARPEQPQLTKMELIKGGAEEIEEAERQRQIEIEHAKEFPPIDPEIIRQQLKKERIARKQGKRQIRNLRRGL
jgi:hypothetical protein